MKQKMLFLLSLLLLIEGYFLLLSFGIEKTGNATSFSVDQSVQNILIVVFIVTLISILIAIKFLDPPYVKDKLAHESKLSSLYALDVLELHKNRRGVYKDMESKGYRKEEIDSFMKEWEKQEENVEREEKNLTGQG